MARHRMCFSICYDFMLYCVTFAVSYVCYHTEHDDGAIFIFCKCCCWFVFISCFSYHVSRPFMFMLLLRGQSELGQYCLHYNLSQSIKLHFAYLRVGINNVLSV